MEALALPLNSTLSIALAQDEPEYFFSLYHPKESCYRSFRLTNMFVTKPDPRPLIYTTIFSPLTDFDNSLTVSTVDHHFNFIHGR